MLLALTPEILAENLSILIDDLTAATGVTLAAENKPKL
jgi:hypothetical protein